MSLHDSYTPEFEKLWNLYPKHPIGRSNKKLAFTAFCNAKRILKFDAGDLDFIARDIASRLIACETWQPGNKYGPTSFARYFNARLWNEPFVRKGQSAPQRGYDVAVPDEPRAPYNPERARAVLAQIKKELH